MAAQRHLALSVRVVGIASRHIPMRRLALHMHKILVVVDEKDRLRRSSLIEVSISGFLILSFYFSFSNFPHNPSNFAKFARGKPKYLLVLKLFT